MILSLYGGWRVCSLVRQHRFTLTSLLAFFRYSGICLVMPFSDSVRTVL